MIGSFSNRRKSPFVLVYPSFQVQLTLPVPGEEGRDYDYD